MRPLPLAVATLAFAAVPVGPLTHAADVTVITPDTPADVTVIEPGPPEVTVVEPAPTTTTIVKLEDANEVAAVEAVPADSVTVVYVYPTSPQTFVTVDALPSFLVQPGAPMPQIASYVVQSVTMPVLPGPTVVAASADLDCNDLPGPVFVGPADPHDLDQNGNGIGCEPGER